jgi:hypothetical protein
VQIFLSKQDEKSKKLMMNIFTLFALLYLTRLNKNNFTEERLMMKKMSENDVVCKKLLTNQTTFTARE